LKTIEIVKLSKTYGVYAEQNKHFPLPRNSMKSIISHKQHSYWKKKMMMTTMEELLPVLK
jgi:hypothetical protein